MVKTKSTPEVAVILKAQAPGPLQFVAEPLPPVQPAKVDPVVGETLRFTAVFSARLTLQVPLLVFPFQAQLIPFPFTVPLPVPEGLTVSEYI
jgi:hypothetical protein